MRKLIALPLLAAFTLVLGITAANAQSTDYKHVFEATLSGDEEVPEVETDATGEAAFGVNQDERRVDYQLNVFDGENITAAHLHCGTAGENGPIVAPLFMGEARDVDGTLSSGTLRASDIMVQNGAECDVEVETVPHLIQAMREGRIYVNVHSTEHPDGLIRDQVMENGGSSDLLNGDGNDDQNGDDQNGDQDGDQNGDQNGDDNGDNGDQNGDDQNGDANGDGELPRVEDISIEFEEGIYTLTGTVLVQSACYVLGTDVNVSEGDPDSVFINLTTARGAQENCAQVLTERDFVRAFEADSDADITIALNDVPIDFNGDDGDDNGDQNGDDQNGDQDGDQNGDQNGDDNGDQNGDDQNGNGDDGRDRANVTIGNGFGVFQLPGDESSSFARFRYGDDNANTESPYELAAGLDATNGDLYNEAGFDHESGETEEFTLSYSQDTSTLTLAVGDPEADEPESVVEYSDVPTPGDALALTSKITEGTTQSVNVSFLSLMVGGENVPMADQDTWFHLDDSDADRTKFLLIEEVDLSESFELMGEVTFTYEDEVSEETPGLTFELATTDGDQDGDDNGDQNGDNGDNGDDNGDDQNGDNGEEDTATLSIMKHICDADIQSVEDFNSVDRNGDGETTFVDKVLACPTVIMPGDTYTPDAIHYPDRIPFDFSVSSTTETQTIVDAAFEQSAIWEPNFDADFNGDGDMIDGLGTSHYTYENVANGYIVVDEVGTPSNTRPGALEFTPDFIMENNDMDTLLANNLEEDGTIELAMNEDDNGEVMLHVYNFRTDGDDGDDQNGDQDDNGDDQNGDQDDDQNGDDQNGDDQNGDDQNGDDNGDQDGDQTTEQMLLERLEELFDELSIVLTDLFQLN